jgi:multidrug resistance efflux pump
LELIMRKEQVTMKKNLILFGAVIFLALIVAGGWWWRSRASAASSPTAFEATGVLEARQAHLSTEVGGQVVEVLVEEGQRVKAGQVLVKLDGSLLQSQRDQAQAAVQAALANLALLQAGATEEQIAAAEAQLAQANASLSAAQAGLYTATGGSRPEEIAAARAFLEQARAGYYDMKVALTNDQVEILRNLATAVEERLEEAKGGKVDLQEDAHNPASGIEAADAAISDLEKLEEDARQTLEAAEDASQPAFGQIEQARLTWETAQKNVIQAQARLDSLERQDRMADESNDAAQAALDDARELAEKAQAAYQALTSGPAAVKLEAAWGEVQRAQEQLAALGVSSQAVPALGQLPVETLIIQVDAAGAAREVAEANLEFVKRGTRSEQIDAAQAQVDVAQAQLEGIDEQIEKLTLTAPGDGIVLARSIEPGEIALPGGTFLEIGKLDVLELTIYLPEDRFGLAEMGQEVSVQVDAYPDRTFKGSLMRIADEAEFTPSNVQTKEDRSRLVYAVVIRMENPDLLLKPGMIADVNLNN